jgi:hypothetical protein
MLLPATTSQHHNLNVAAANHQWAKTSTSAPEFLQTYTLDLFPQTPAPLPHVYVHCHT